MQISGASAEFAYDPLLGAEWLRPGSGAVLLRWIAGEDLLATAKISWEEWSGLVAGLSLEGWVESATAWVIAAALGHSAYCVRNSRSGLAVLALTLDDAREARANMCAMSRVDVDHVHILRLSRVRAGASQWLLSESVRLAPGGQACLVPLNEPEGLIWGNGRLVAVINPLALGLPGREARALASAYC